MSRWRKALIAASVGMVASAAYVATSSIPGQAESSLVANYHCVDGVAGSGVDLEARMTPQVESGIMNVRWDMSYRNERRFGSPGFFAEGSSLDLEGVVNITGAWEGQLRPRGGKEQGELVPGDYLDLPEGLSDSASITRTGKIRFKPGRLTVRFTPAEGEVMVNDTNEVTYSSGWAWEHTGEPYDDHINDLHKTETAGATATFQFTGTKVAYIGRRAPDLGPIEVTLDGNTVTDPLVEPGKDRSGQAMTGTESQQVLWESPDLDYGPHTVVIRNVENKVAYVDAFKVTTGGITDPPDYDQATCRLQGNPGAIEINLPGSTPSTSPTPGETPPTDDPPTDESPNPDPSDTETDNPPNNDNDDLNLGHVVVRPTATATQTVTPRSTGPTATKYYRAQVPKTPSGGVDTGEAPEENQPHGLLTGGMALVMGSAGGGLLLRRRRAAHAGGADA
ncbi:hypothetical protein GBF35_04545 [Nonomuraea phyllanthi]|uniref:hypothetical protein n=1 Tax=Nonomuraea phyllanthi TaxID=2219224 RepID=UPI0012934B24|nr:hypothetical protein [Nonomuraea phyllanthi]QFY06041.1 hypothetical protein GBF35_04545 [Nonomuraea phyllanthi]